MTKAKSPDLRCSTVSLFVRAEMFGSSLLSMPCSVGGAVSTAEHVSTAGDVWITFNE
jgi:hypothetical protein